MVTYLTMFLFCHMFDLTVTVPCLTPPLPTVTVPWRCTSAPPSLMTDPHPSSTSSPLSSLLSTNGPLLKERKKKKRLAYFVLCDVVIRGPRSVTETNHLMEHVTLLRIKFLYCGNSLRPSLGHPCDVLQMLPQTLNVSA